MTDIAEQKNNLKKHVRALLVSSPVELTVKELIRDFHTFIGVPLDFRGIGYATIEDFLRDIEDAVHISWKNGHMTVKAISDETDKHIAKLVSKQKVTNKKKYGVYRNRNQPRYSSGPPRFEDRFRSAGHQAPPKRIIPAYVRNQVQGLFRSFPDGLALDDIDLAYGRKYGTQLNFKNYGFNTMLDIMQSMPDLVKVLTRGPNVYTIVPFGYSRPRQRHESHHSVRTDGTSVHVSQEKSQNEKRPSKGRGRRRFQSGDSQGTSEDHVGHDSRSVVSGGSNSSGSSNRSKGRLEAVEEEIRQLLENKPKGMWAARLPHEYAVIKCHMDVLQQNQFRKSLDYRDFGYISVVDFIDSMPDTVRIERPCPRGDWMLFDARLPRDTETVQHETPQQKPIAKSVIETTQEMIHQVLESRPNGIPVNHFQDVYREFTGHDLPIRECGFDSPQQLFLSMADSVLQVAYIDNVGLVLFLPDADLSTIHMESPEPPVEESPRSSGYPEDAVGPGCHYMPVMCPDIDQYVGLYVSNIVNPGLFWVILRHKEKSLALENLMDRLDEAYSRASDEYQMPESLMVPGQVCATLFPEDNNWHRGVITGSNETGFISIYFIDYGNTSFVNKNAVKFLKQEFLTLPAQAIQSRLANVHPPTGKWKVKSRNRLLEMCKEKALVAYVTKVQCQIMSLCLTDTNDPQVDVHINDTLVKEGHGVFCPDEDYPEERKLQQHAEVPNYGIVFGTTKANAPRLPHAAGDATPVSEEQCPPENVAGGCLVKWVQVTKDHVLHIINLDRRAHVVSAEVSSFIWEEDILFSMINQKRMDVPKMVISSDKYPGLFQDLTRYEVKSMKAEMLGKKQFLSLYRLDSVPSILRVFAPEKEELVASIEELVAKFDPDSPYWKSCEVISNKPLEEEELQISQEDQQMALQSLQIKRKRILQELMGDMTNTDQTVNELNRCEIEIMMIKQELEENQGMYSRSTSREAEMMPIPRVPDTQPGTSQAISAEHKDRETENQRVIQNIIASSTKPIATANIMTKPTTSLAYSNPLTTTSTDMFGNHSATGSMQGIMGTNTFAQQQRFVNPYMLAQAGIVPGTGMMDMTRMFTPTNLNTRMTLTPNQSLAPGRVSSLDPALEHLQKSLMSVSGSQQLLNASLVNQMGGSMPSIGRGQLGDLNNNGLLPGLYPLLQNLTLGRGAGRGSGSSGK